VRDTIYALLERIPEPLEARMHAPEVDVGVLVREDIAKAREPFQPAFPRWPRRAMTLPRESAMNGTREMASKAPLPGPLSAQDATMTPEPRSRRRGLRSYLALRLPVAR